MKQSINFYQFKNWFKENRPNNFSDAGLLALFNYVEEYEENSGQEIEFDPIALCVEYQEYDDLEAFWSDYDKEKYPDLETLRDYTEVIEINSDRFIILMF